jgi:integrase
MCRPLSWFSAFLPTELADALTEALWGRWAASGLTNSGSATSNGEKVRCDERHLLKPARYRNGHGNDYVFHSFRKGVATQLEAAEIPENHVARLLGHDLKTMSYGVYSGGVPYEILQLAVECLDWR